MSDTPKASGGNNGAQKPQKKPMSAYRKLRRKLSKTPLRIPHIWLRHQSLTPSDVIFSSYPRSGTTWSRFTLYELLSGKPSGFSAVNAGVCGIGKHKNAPRLLPNHGRLIASHEQYRKEYKRAVYIVRDCRDVLLSEFAYTTAIEFFSGDLDKFIRTFFLGKISPFAPWPKHVKGWLDSPLGGTPNLLVVRYEDLRKDPPAGFRKIVDYLGVKVSEDRLQAAIANNALEKMKEKEQVEPQRASVKGRFVRSGTIQGWRAKLTPEQAQFVDQQAGSVLKRLGYPLFSELKEAESAEQLTPSLRA